VSRMDSLREILPRMIKTLGLQKRFEAEIVILKWRQIVGEDIATNTRPGKISRRVLTVAAKNAVWAHHLSTLKEEIIAKINAFAGEKAVSDIKFLAGYFRIDQNENKDDSDDYPAVNWREISLDSREAKAVEDMAAPVSDDLLRGKMKRLLRMELTLKKMRRLRNWQPCPACGVPKPPGEELCGSCQTFAREKGRKAVRRLLRDAPWLSYEECSRYVACRRCDYSAAKEQLADELLRAMTADEKDRVGLPMLTMLFFGAKPQEITAEMTAKTLAKARRKSDVSPSRR
jgi:predicted nucleic acid-binding Zn ribbon protein